MEREGIILSSGILAGGKSTRMGRDKARLKIGDSCLIEVIASELGKLGGVLISEAEKGDFEEFGYGTVFDERRDTGPIEGIRQVLKHASGEYVFICAADMPFIKATFVQSLARFIEPGYDCFVTVDEGKIEPLCAVYKKSVLPVIEELMEMKEYRLRNIFSKAATKYVPLSETGFDKRVISNINTIREYEELLRETGS